MRVVPVACLRDNYAYLVVREGRALVVDASEAAPVEAALAAEGLELVAVLSTHHHGDHVDGNEELAARRPGLPVLAFHGDTSRVPAITRGVDEGPIEVAGFSLRALHVPGHTTGALAYCIEHAVFTGDTLFVAGCGRVFEGTPAMMHASLAKLAALPPETRVYCGHEYTTKNLAFALSTEPHNESMRAKLDWATAQRAAGRATVPSTIAEERATNPFLRCTSVDAFAATRAAKDAF